MCVFTEERLWQEQISQSERGRCAWMGKPSMENWDKEASL